MSLIEGGLLAALPTFILSANFSSASTKLLRKRYWWVQNPRLKIVIIFVKKLGWWWWFLGNLNHISLGWDWKIGHVTSFNLRMRSLFNCVQFSAVLWASSFHTFQSCTASFSFCIPLHTSFSILTCAPFLCLESFSKSVWYSHSGSLIYA